MAYLRYLSFSRFLGWEAGCDGPPRKTRSGCSRPGADRRVGTNNARSAPYGAQRPGHFT